MSKDVGWHERKAFPPAGTECEILMHSNEWRSALVIGTDRDGDCVAHVDFGSHYGYRSSPNISEFRPLKTDGERERDAAIEEMAKATLTPDAGNTISICKLLYDAGYRKPMSREQANERLAYHVTFLLSRPFARIQILDALYYGKE